MHRENSARKKPDNGPRTKTTFGSLRDGRKLLPSASSCAVSCAAPCVSTAHLSTDGQRRCVLHSTFRLEAARRRPPRQVLARGCRALRVAVRAPRVAVTGAARGTALLAALLHGPSSLLVRACLRRYVLADRYTRRLHTHGANLLPFSLLTPPLTTPEEACLRAVTTCRVRGSYRWRRVRIYRRWRPDC